MRIGKEKRGAQGRGEQEEVNKKSGAKSAWAAEKVRGPRKADEERMQYHGNQSKGKKENHSTQRRNLAEHPLKNQLRAMTSQDQATILSARKGGERK